MYISNVPSPEVLLQRLLARGRLRQLQLLVALADCGSVQRAGQAMAMSQPAATQALADLEDLVGESLFERHARGVRPTRFGEVLLPMARSVVQSLRNATESVAALQAGTRALLRLGVIPAGASSVLGPFLPTWLQSHPDVHVDLVEDHSRHLMAELAAGRLDALICRAPHGPQGHWLFHPLCADQPALITHPQHPLAGAQHIDWATACKHPWLLPHRGMALRDHLSHLWSNAVPCSPPLHALCTTSLPAIQGILQDLHTIALAPLSVVQAWVESGQVALLDLVLPGLHDEPAHLSLPPLSPLGLLHPLRSDKLALLEGLHQHLQAQLLEVMAA